MSRDAAGRWSSSSTTKPRLLSRGRAAASLLLLLLLLSASALRGCSAESDAYDLGAEDDGVEVSDEEDDYVSPYLSPQVYDDNYFGDLDEDLSASSSTGGGAGGRADYWGGANVATEAARFGERLRNLANEEIGTAIFQAAYDARTYVDDVGPAEKASQIARRMQLKLRSYEEAVAASRGLAERLAAEQRRLGLAAFATEDRLAAAKAVDCCALNTSLLRDDLRYTVPVVTHMTCDLQAPSSAWDVSIPRAELTDVFRNNSRRLPGLKWQYFISLKSNVHCEYPAHPFPMHRDGSCPMLAYHRHRDSIVAALLPPGRRRVMAIVMDSGCSLSDNQMSSAIAVAGVLIESLSETDLVAVLVVSNETAVLSALPGCFAASALPQPSVAGGAAAVTSAAAAASAGKPLHAAGTRKAAAASAAAAAEAIASAFGGGRGVASAAAAGGAAGRGAAAGAEESEATGSSSTAASAHFFLHASSDAKQHLRHAVHGVTRSVSMTNHTLAFVAAFGMFRVLLSERPAAIGEGADLSIAYISRGLMSTLNDARQVLSTIRTENAQLDSRVRIDVYALVDSGKPLIYEPIFLRDIATQNASRFDALEYAGTTGGGPAQQDAVVRGEPQPPRGRLVNVTSSIDLRPVIDGILLSTPMASMPPGSRRRRRQQQQQHQQRLNASTEAAVHASSPANSASKQAAPHYSPLHLDVIDREPVVSLIMPCIGEDNTAFGVVGADLRLNDLAEDVLHFGCTERQYAFIVSTTGQAFAHPMLVRPRASDEPQSTSGFVSADIRVLESHPRFADVFRSIVGSPNGTAALHDPPSDDVCSRGYDGSSKSAADGVAACRQAGTTGGGSNDRTTTVTTYSWQRVERTPYVVVVKVVQSGGSHSGRRPATLRKLAGSATESARAIWDLDAVVYHRVDLLPTDSTCLYFGHLSTFDASTFFLSPKAFRNSYDYMHKLETRTSAQSYVAYLRDASGLISNPGLRDDVRQDVAVTALLHKYWLERQRIRSPLNDYILRRYVATAGGVARSYPGMALSKAFDPTMAPWYIRAAASPGRLTLLAPARAGGRRGGDSAGIVGPVASLSQTIYEGSSQGLHTSDDPVAAVVGLDVSSLLLYKWLLEAMPRACDAALGTRCFVVDDSGYVIAHPNLGRVAGAAAPVEQGHITHMEPWLAADLIAHRDIATKKLCINTADRTMQRYYAFNTSMTGVKQNLKIGDSCLRYQIAAVPRTNAFLAVINNTCSPSVPAFCPCSTTDRHCLNCDRAEQSECECPCECPARFGHAMGACDVLGTERPAVDRTTGAAAAGVHSPLNASANLAAAVKAAVGAAGSSALDDRGLNCWPVPGDSWDAAALVLPLPPFVLSRKLPTCRSTPDCANRTTARECVGVLGCEWCTEQVAVSVVRSGGDSSGRASLSSERAPLSQPYCSPRSQCTGGLFRLESVNDDRDSLLVAVADATADGSDQLRGQSLGGATAPVGPVAGAVMGTFLLVALGVYCYRHFAGRRNGTSECNREALASGGQELCAPLAAGADLAGHDQHDHQPPAPDGAAAGNALRGHVNLLLLIDHVANVSPYRMNANYRRPHYAAAAATTTESSDRGYSSLTQADDDGSASVLTAAASVVGRRRVRELSAGGGVSDEATEYDDEEEEDGRRLSEEAELGEDRTDGGSASRGLPDDYGHGADTTAASSSGFDGGRLDTSSSLESVPLLLGHESPPAKSVQDGRRRKDHVGASKRVRDRKPMARRQQQQRQSNLPTDRKWESLTSGSNDSVSVAECRPCSSAEDGDIASSVVGRYARLLPAAGAACSAASGSIVPLSRDIRPTARLLVPAATGAAECPLLLSPEGAATELQTSVC